MTDTDSEITAMARAICFESQWPSCREEGIGRMPSCLAPTCGCNHIAEALAARTASRKWMEENIHEATTGIGQRSQDFCRGWNALRKLVTTYKDEVK